MKRVLLCLFLMVSQLFSAEEISYYWENNECAEGVEEVFVKVFSEAYRDVPLEVLRVDNLEGFLRSAKWGIFFTLPLIFQEVPLCMKTIVLRYTRGLNMSCFE